MPRDRFQRQALGTLNTTIKQSRALLIGAGGIGCELLKNLVLCGFSYIEVVDLDTIDLSNLNRQFLFRQEHIKRPKAIVAKETASKFNPNVTIEARHANIKDPTFNIDWFSGFNIVFNALDNLEARRHVNKMCLAANVPLIESGTTGFNGQVQVIKKSETECYDCNPKETPKTYPVCTIRSTPSLPIHCIVWAKSYLFAEIFGISEDDAPELDNSENSDNAKEIENLRQEAQALKRIREAMGSEDFPQTVFDKVFKEDVERLRSMEDMWRTRQKPEPLDFDKLSHEALGVGKAIAEQDQTTWTTAENFAVFSTSLRKLSDRLDELRATADVGNAAPILSFDKDDNDMLDFVAASANLRATIFGIDPQPKFEIKQMAGNIIPAIATTNAMAAGLCVLQAFKVLRSEYQKARMVFLTQSNDRALASEPLRPPRPDCPVCGISQSRVEVDLGRATLKDLTDGLLRSELAYGDEFSVTTDAGILYDPELDDNLPKKLSELDIKQDSFITVIDEDDDSPRVNLLLVVADKPRPDDAKPVALPDTLDIARKPRSQPAADPAVANGVHKRKRSRSADEAELEAELVKKRGKVVEENGHGHPAASSAANDGDAVVVVSGKSNGHGGAIVIEDD